MNEDLIKILLVEDKNFDAELITETLKNEEIQAEYLRATNKDEFIQLLNNDSFDIVLCDYTIPGFSDLEASILFNNQDIDVPFIYLSGLQNDKTGVESLKHGAADYISKENLHRLALSVVKALHDNKEKRALKEDNVRLTNFINYSSDLLLTVNSKEIILNTNIQAASLFKLKPENMQGVHLSEFFRKETYHKLRENILRVNETSQKQIDKILADLPYGNRWFYTTFIPNSESGKLTRSISLILTDITDKEFTPELPEGKENSMDVLFKNAPDAFYIRDLDGYVLELNKAAEKITGFDREEMVGKHFLDTNIIPTSQKEEFLQMLKASNDGKNIVPQEFQIIHKNGSKIFVEKTAYPFTYKGKKRVLGIVSDITPRKEAENKLKESEEKFKALVKSTEDIIFLVDKNYIYRGLYGKGLGKLGFDQRKYKGMKVREIFDKETAETHIDAIKKAFNGNFEIYTWFFCTPMGERTFQTSLSPIYNENGAIQQVVGIGRDITDIQEMLKELEEAKEKAEENDRLKSAFLANISHEIRTPMNGILGFTQLLQNNELPEGKRKEFLDVIKGRGEHLLQIINDIIDISKIESNQLTLEKSNVSLRKRLNELQLFYSQILETKEKHNVTLYLTEPEEDISIYTDNERLEQILSNLLDNAIKFTENGTVEFGYQYYNKANILFYVKDSGIGIPEDKMDIIFKPFRQVDNSDTRPYEGTGLGLTITKQLIERLGGKIWINSQSGKGSIFYFTLPNQQANKKDPENDKEGLIKLDLKGKTILIVEDDTQSRQYLSEIFEPTDVKLEMAENGMIAWDKFIQDKSINLILMDIRLPDINGLDLTKKIKDINPDLPIIAQTAYVMKKDKSKALEKGCDDYISKPINQNTLFKLVRRHLRINQILL